MNDNIYIKFNYSYSHSNHRSLLKNYRLLYSGQFS